MDERRRVMLRGKKPVADSWQVPGWTPHWRKLRVQSQLAPAAVEERVPPGSLQSNLTVYPSDFRHPSLRHLIGAGSTIDHHFPSQAGTQ